MQKLGIAACVVLLALATGCASFRDVLPSGVSRGVLIGDVVYPGVINSHSQYQFARDDFEILKTLTTQATSTNILGLFGSGDNGYGKLLEKARELGADDVINIKVDTRHQSLLAVFYTKSTTVLTGTAVRWKK